MNARNRRVNRDLPAIGCSRDDRDAGWFMAGVLTQWLVLLAGYGAWQLIKALWRLP